METRPRRRWWRRERRAVFVYVRTRHDPVTYYGTHTFLGNSEWVQIRGLCNATERDGDVGQRIDADYTIQRRDVR
jgi:hypothetical protein